MHTLAAIERKVRRLRSSTCFASTLQCILRLVLSAARKAANITTSSSTAAAAVADEEGTAVLPVALPDYCSGCGVKLQMEDPDAPG